MSQVNVSGNKSRIHYGWMVVLGGFLTQIILMCGLQFVPILMAPIKESLQLTNTTAGTLVSVFGLCYAGFSFLWGYMADRFGGRVAVSVAGMILGIFVIIFGLVADSFTKAVIFIAIVGFGAAGVYSATIPKLIGAWFHPRKRGRAMSTITAGGVITGAVFGVVLPRMANAFGWRATAVFMGVLAIVCVLIVYLVVRNKPEEKGLQPVGLQPGETMPADPPKKEGALKEVAKMKISWHVSSMFIFWQVGFMVATSFISVSFVNAGFTAVEGGLAVTIYNLLQLVGQQIWGPLSDKLERKTVIFIAAAWWTLATVGYILVYGSSIGIMFFMIALMGIGMGMVPVILASFSDYFPTEVRGTGSGFVSTMGVVGRFFGPMVAGMVADAVGSSTGAFGFGAACMAVAAIIALTLPSLKKNVAVEKAGKAA